MAAIAKAEDADGLAALAADPWFRDGVKASGNQEKAIRAAYAKRRADLDEDFEPPAIREVEGAADGD